MLMSLLWEILWSWPMLWTCLTVVLLAYVTRRQSSTRSPPGPWPWPILGHMPHLAMHPRQYELLTSWAERYGDVLMVYLGSRPAVVVSGWDRVKEALVDKGPYFADRPNWLYTPREIFKCKGILWTNGATWRQLRKFTAVSLRDFGLGKKPLEENVKEEVGNLVTAFGSKAGLPIFPIKLLKLMAFNMIWSIVFGKRNEDDEVDVAMLQDKLAFMFLNAGTHIPEDFLPWLRFIPMRSPAAPLIENDKKIKEYVRKQIDKHRLNFDPNNIRDFIDLYLKIVHEGKTTETLSEENIFRVIVDLFLAGSESTSISINWAVFYLTKFPDVQEKCQAEIDNMLDADCEVSMADRDKLPYTMATISEIQRHANVVPAIPPHSVTSDVELNGYRLPRETIVIFNLQSVHHDPRYWNQPEAFRPERWLDARGKLIKREPFIPFSIGPRTCLGEWLARRQIFHSVVSLLRCFNLVPPEGERLPELKPAVQAITNHPPPFCICAHDRRGGLDKETL